MRWPLAGVLAAVFAPAIQAQEFPSRPVRLVVPFAAGGIIDIMGRLMTPVLGKGLGQNVIVDDKLGGGTAVGTEIVARAPADGHTILPMGPSFIINLFARTKLPYDTQR